MILYEYEGKKLLSQAGIHTPQSQLLNSADTTNTPLTISLPMVLKAQVLSGKRAQVGGIVMIDTPDQLQSEIERMFSQTINSEKVEQILVESKVDIDKEFYLSLSYDTDYRSLVLTLSESGGTGIEERGAMTYLINILKISESLDPISTPIPKDILEKSIQLFLDQDCTLLEINPLVQTHEGEWMALDAKIKLDDSAVVRHEDWDFKPRGVPGYTPTQNEVEAKKIDQDDYRGTAGSAYFDIAGGDIAILSSGGGISLTAMDTLIALGAKPANFTEYSGNPPKEKVVKLTKIVLNKPNIHGLWVIGTVAANFTDIYETLSGLIDGLREAEKELNKKFDFPIVIRRGGPREKEAFEMLRQVKDFNLILQGEEVSVSQSAEVIAKQAAGYASAKGAI